MSDWRSSPLKRFEAAAISAIGYRLCAALGATLKWRVEGLQHYDAVVLGGRQPIMGFWHGRILPAALYFKRRGIVVITSENFDGEWIAGIIERFGYGTARGSTSRGGSRALIQMKRDMEAGKPTGFTLDGPRGPAHVAQTGAVWLSKATGNPVLLFHLEADRHWTMNSWDGTQIPKPFSTVALVVGEPFVVPGDATEAEMENARQRIEQQLQQLEARALELSSRGSASEDSVSGRGGAAKP